MTTYNLTKNDTPKFISCSKKGTPKNGTSRTSIYGSYPPGPICRNCRTVWGCRGVTEENHLQKLQNRAARIITIDSFDAPGISLLRRLGWKTVEEFIAHESELMVFKSLHGLAPQYVSDLFTKISQLTSHNLRIIVTDLWPPQKRPSSGLKSFSYRGAKTWNSIPTICKQAIATRDFKSYL